jgi:hypothetical protein
LLVLIAVQIPRKLLRRTKRSFTFFIEKCFFSYFYFIFLDFRNNKMIIADNLSVIWFEPETEPSSSLVKVDSRGWLVWQT